MSSIKIVDNSKVGNKTTLKLVLKKNLTRKLKTCQWSDLPLRDKQTFVGQILIICLNYFWTNFYYLFQLFLNKLSSNKMCSNILLSKTLPAFFSFKTHKSKCNPSYEYFLIKVKKKTFFKSSTELLLIILWRGIVWKEQTDT